MNGTLRSTGVMLACLLAGCAITPASDDTDARATLAVLATTDLHGHVLGYDYYQLREDDTIGLDRVATLIGQARGEFDNTVLVDNGDTIQGSPLADLQAQQPPPCDQPLAIFKAMNTLGYDAATLGNHEFNFGLPFLRRVTGQVFDDSGVRCAGPNFPLVSSNVVMVDSGEPLFPPALLLERELRAETGDGASVQVPIRIGVVGVVPPAILAWDRGHLDGKVEVEGVLAATQREVARLREQGADLIIALSHGGIDDSPYTAVTENGAWHLAANADIDALVMGHQHLRFPQAGAVELAFEGVGGIDHANGRIHNVPAVMAGSWGRALGVIQLALIRQDGRWQVDRSMSRSELRFVADAGGEPVPSDPAMAVLVGPEHQAAIAKVSEPIGHSEFAMDSCFAEIGDVSALQVVNAAQVDAVRDYIGRNLPQYADLPVLSAAAPFKSGRGGPDDYTRVPAGTLALRNAADLYLFPNTLMAVKIDGAGLKAWLERSAERFNRIDPDSKASQALINTLFPGYNFDVIHGVDYVIDITRPVGQRIVSLAYDGKPVADDQPFIVATNNYRAGGGGRFPGLGAGADIVVDAQVANRDVLIDWLHRTGRLTLARHGRDRPWRFAPVRLAGEVVFETCAGTAGDTRAVALAARWQEDLPDGRARFTLAFPDRSMH